MLRECRGLGGNRRQCIRCFICSSLMATLEQEKFLDPCLEEEDKNCKISS